MGNASLVDNLARLAKAFRNTLGYNIVQAHRQLLTAHVVIRLNVYDSIAVGKRHTTVRTADVRLLRMLLVSVERYVKRELLVSVGRKLGNELLRYGETTPCARVGKVLRCNIRCNRTGRNRTSGRARIGSISYGSCKLIKFAVEACRHLCGTLPCSLHGLGRRVDFFYLILGSLRNSVGNGLLIVLKHNVRNAIVELHITVLLRNGGVHGVIFVEQGNLETIILALVLAQRGAYVLRYQQATLILGVGEFGVSERRRTDLSCLSRAADSKARRGSLGYGVRYALRQTNSQSLFPVFELNVCCATVGKGYGLRFAISRILTKGSINRRVRKHDSKVELYIFVAIRTRNYRLIDFEVALIARVCCQYLLSDALYDSSRTGSCVTTPRKGKPFLRGFRYGVLEPCWEAYCLSLLIICEPEGCDAVRKRHGRVTCTVGAAQRGAIKGYGKVELLRKIICKVTADNLLDFEATLVLTVRELHGRIGLRDISLGLALFDVLR